MTPAPRELSQEQNMTSELKPCPWCGKAPEYTFIPENEFGTWDTHNIACHSTNDHDVQVIDLTKDAAFKKWNTRVTEVRE